jgi:hypothetical protein
MAEGEQNLVEDENHMAASGRHPQTRREPVLSETATSIFQLLCASQELSYLVAQSTLAEHSE